jgi:glycosyltransferase involved in cell wall biosynthesis
MTFNTGIVMFHHAAFGGATRRYTNLFIYLNKQHPGNFYYFINNHFYNQLRSIYPNLPLNNIKIIDYKKNLRNKSDISYGDKPTFYQGVKPDPEEIDRSVSLPRKIYWFFKNWYRQYKLFRIIESYREELDIKVFIGVYSGIFPLVFYLKQKPRKAAVIFSDMDSYFYEVISDMKKMWYRKYYSFNYALENSDIVDFLSPYILEGIKKRNVNVKEDSVSISTCSFTDYSKCEPGTKENIEIAFASRLEPEKNPLMYLEAAKQISMKYKGIKFHLLGEGTLIPEVENFINSNNLHSVVNFEFHKTPKDVFIKTSVFVSIQSNNNYPSQSLLEAMACCNAVIASDVGDTRLLVNERNGILIPLEIQSLIAALEKLIKSPELTKSLGINGRQFVLTNHTIEKHSDYWVNIAQNAHDRLFSKKYFI